MTYQVTDKIKFLSDASKILAQSLDYDLTLKNIATLAVDYISDFCMIDLFDEQNKLYRVAARVSGTDKERIKLARQMFRYPADPGNKAAIYESARIGKPILIKTVNQSWLNKASRISEEHKVLHKLGCKSFIFAPLKSRKKVIGVLTLVSSDKNFSYSQSDVVLAQELANRAGIAVDNAKLYTTSQEALKHRDLFISMAAHELRTPLTTVNGYLQLLQTQTKSIPAKCVGWVNEMLRETNRLSLLINELLETSRINAGQLHYVFRELNIEDIVKKAIANFSFNFPNRTVNFKNSLAKTKGRIIGDAGKLQQVITNLLDNAAKFSPQDSIITVALADKDQDIILSVKDLGEGIPEKDLKSVFEVFYKANPKSETGMGIGLFLAKKIINQHQGDINIRSKENKGTIVEIKLPQAPL